jgi:hypothetical protein
MSRFPEVCFWATLAFFFGCVTLLAAEEERGSSREHRDTVSVDTKSLQLDDAAAELDVQPVTPDPEVRRALTPPPARGPFTLAAPAARTAATATALQIQLRR